MADPTKQELEIEVEALRKQNHDLTNALLHFFQNGGLVIRAVWSATDDKAAAKVAMDEIKERALVTQAAQLVMQKLGERATLYRHNSILKSYALAHIHESSVRYQLMQDLYGDYTG